MILSHRIQLDPTFAQRAYFAQAAGTSRFVWNLALAEWNRQHEAGEKPNGMRLKKEFNATKYELYPWLKDTHRDAHSQPFANLDKAFKRFFKKQGNHPVFKKKGKCVESFAVANDKFRLEGLAVVLPKIGHVRLTEELRFTGKIMSATVSRTADKWFISIQVDVGDYSRPRTSDDIIGVDLGIKTAATLSTGEQFQSSKPLKNNLNKLKRVQRKLARQQKGSKNRQKTKTKLARIYAKVVNIRKDFLHKLTTTIAKNHGVVVIENLNVKGMMKNRRLSRAISDIGFSEFRRQLEYKSAIYGTQIVVADRWYPSSKTCHACGHIKQDLTLKQRQYECDSCGVQFDRDMNAALNLKTLGLREIACGQPDNPGSNSGAGLVEAGTKPCALVSTH